MSFTVRFGPNVLLIAVTHRYRHSRNAEWSILRYAALISNPLITAGIDAQTIRFLDTFLLFCLLSDSPETNNQEYKNITENMRRTVYNGRDPNVELLQGVSPVPLRDWGTSLINAMTDVAKRLDEAHQSPGLQRGIDHHAAKAC